MNFLGFLMNVDSSILKVNFGEDMSVSSVPIEDAYHMLKELDNFEDYGIFVHETIDVMSNDKEFYVLRSEFDSDNSPTGTMAFHKDAIEPLVNGLLPKLRLFKEGNIQLPLFYLYTQQDGKLVRRERGGFVRPAHFPNFHVEESEIEKLEDFVGSIEVPFSEEYVNLAYQSYDMSYGWIHPNMSFLLLMIGIESLFTQSERKIVHNISNRAAALLGKSSEGQQSLRRQVKELYKMRSNIVHGAPGLVARKADVSALRSILRKSIKEVALMSISKVDLIRELDARGGEKPLSDDGQ